MRPHRIPLIAIFLMMTILPAGGLAQDVDARPGVAVLPFDVTQIPPTDLGASGLDFGLQQMLLSELQANPALRIVDRRALNEVLREQDLYGSGRVDGSTAAEIGQIVGARYMIGTSYFDNTGEVRLDARVIDVETTEVIETARATDRRDNLFDLVGALAAEVTSAVDLPQLPDVVRTTRAEQSVPQEGLDLYFAAVARDEAGEVDEALELLSVVLERWPDYADAAQMRVELLDRRQQA